MIRDSFVIEGGKPLKGQITIQTSKNASLPIMAASVMVKGDMCIKSIPKISDIDNMIDILVKLGVDVKKKNNDIIINSDKATGIIDADLSKTMRSSIFLLGSTLARFKTTIITAPGGCKIGVRPIDIHIKGYEDLGVRVCNIGKLIYFDATNAKAGRVKLKIPSVGATENLIQFASVLKGKTTIVNAAKEPEVIDLCNFLNKCGAKILGGGTNKITIYGVEKLKGTHYKPIPDRIVAGTIMVATAICGGNVTMRNAGVEQNVNLINKLRSMGCKIKVKYDILKMSSTGKLTSLKKITTGYYPKFATDLQSFMLVASCLAKGTTIIKETVFENRFLILPALKQMGAKVKKINSHTVKVVGSNQIHSANVHALDLRGGASLVLMAMSTNGISIVNNVHFIDRGYENLEGLLTSLGANIKRV